MEYNDLVALRQKHPAWRLLVADHAPLIVGFLFETFIRPNIRTMAEPEITSRLDDYLYSLRSQLGDDAFPRPAMHYLDAWASDEHAWLRKYYPPDSDEPHFDLTPATERAIDWLASLEQRRFVGTESRLMTIFELLRQLAEGTETDPWARIAELERRKADIEAEIRRTREGHLYLLDATRIRERYLQIAATARELLSDFREVEQNFRNLDRAVRERIATWEGGKATLLEEIFGERDTIANSDQGKSFRAFWDFLMSPVRQDELSSLLAKVFDLRPVQELEPDRRMLRVHYDWLQAGEVAQRTVARLSEQLRRYLDDKAWLDNRRIMQLVREIEHSALDVRDTPPPGILIDLDQPSPDIDLTMDRPMFSPPLKPEINEVPLEGISDAPADALFEQVHVDKDRLARRIRQSLQTRPQISLVELAEHYPIEQGLAEIIAYFSIAADDHTSIIDDSLHQTLTWLDNSGLPGKQRFLQSSSVARRRPPPERSDAMAPAIPNPLSLALIALMKGVIERESEAAVWQSVLELQARIRDHVAVLGLELVMDEAEGYAYLRQRPAQEGEADLPRLVPRRQLGYHVSLLLALLRKKLVEFDAASGDTRLILSREEIAETMRLFLPNTANQVRLLERIDANINRVAEMGFLRKLRGTADQFEVRRILKAFVDGQWLAELDGRLKMYRTHAESERIEAAPNEPN